MRCCTLIINLPHRSICSSNIWSWGMTSRHIMYTIDSARVSTVGRDPAIELSSAGLTASPSARLAGFHFLLSRCSRRKCWRHQIESLLTDEPLPSLSLTFTACCLNVNHLFHTAWRSGCAAPAVQYHGLPPPCNTHNFNKSHAATRSKT